MLKNVVILKYNITVMKKGLYLIAIVPPSQVSNSIEELRYQFANNYKAYEALKPPVNIQLYPPIMQSPEKFETEILRLKPVFNSLPSFSVQLHNFGFFQNSKHPVLYIDVVKSNLLKTLHINLSRKITKDFPQFKAEHDFHPHVTIGYRDVMPEIFPQVRKEYTLKSFNASFNVNSVYVFKHNMKSWQVLYEFPLNPVNGDSKQGILL